VRAKTKSTEFCQAFRSSLICRSQGSNRFRRLRVFSGSIGDAAKDSFCTNDPSDCSECFPVLSRDTEWVPPNVCQFGFYLISLQFLPRSVTLLLHVPSCSFKPSCSWIFLLTANVPARWCFRPFCSIYLMTLYPGIVARYKRFSFIIQNGKILCFIY
jgi:hypothetical protein